MGHMVQVVDPVLGDVDDIELAQFCELATWCLEQDGSQRPRMSQAADVLRDISERHAGLPLLPVILPFKRTLALGAWALALMCFRRYQAPIRVEVCSGTANLNTLCLHIPCSWQLSMSNCNQMEGMVRTKN